jgi:hypothetical protein
MERDEILTSLYTMVTDFDDLVLLLKKVAIQQGQLGDFELTAEALGNEYVDKTTKLTELKEGMNLLLEKYRGTLLNKPYSRCPFTGELLSLSIDTNGLDGLWWNSQNPIRLDKKAPSTFYAFDGAMKLGNTLETPPFTVLPGPEIPFVLPRLLNFDQVKAVISQVLIGEHIGYLIAYYCDPFLNYEPRINEWGTERYWEPNPIPGDLTTPGKWISLDPLKSERSFDLDYWILNGKLHWIAPMDETLRLRSSLTDCPFIQLSGSTKYQSVQKGVLSHIEEVEPVFQTEEEFYARIPKEAFAEIENELYEENSFILPSTITLQESKNDERGDM